MLPQEYKTFGTYPSLSSSFGISKGSLKRPNSTVGSSRLNKLAPRQYCRIAPTPCVISNHPLSVSRGEPQLPICVNSHGYFGSCNLCAFSHTFTLSENMI